MRSECTAKCSCILICTTCPYKKKKIIDLSNQKYIQREEGDKVDRILMAEIGIDHIVGIDKDKTLDAIIGDSHKTDAYNMEMIVGEEVIDIKIIIEMTVEIV